MALSPVNRFWNLLSLFKPQLRQIYTYALFIGVVNLTLPIGIQAIINFLQTGEMTTTWIILVFFVLVGIALTGTFQVLQLRIVENIQQNLFARSGMEFAYRIPKIRFLELDRIHAPELVNRFFDTLTIQKGLPKILIDFSLAIFQITFGMILLAIYSSYFILLGLVLALILWLIFKVTGPKGLETSLKESKFKYRLAHWLEEIARVNSSFKLYAKSGFHLNKTDAIVDDYILFREKHFQVLINQFRLFVGFKVILAAGLLVLGGILVFEQRMNIGQFVAAEIIIILIINSVEKVIRTIDTIYDVLTALEKIGYMTDLKLDQNPGSAEIDKNGGLAISAREIYFRFPEERQNVVSNLSFEISAGSKVLLEGPSGSGKSLLLQLLSGIHQIDEGELYVDDVPFTNYERETLYDNLGVSFPTNQLFEGTIRDNILVGRKVSEKELLDILEIMKLKQYIFHQVEGLDSFVDSGGRRLPRSIIQKILISRLIVNSPSLLLMEDPLQFIAEDEKIRIIDYMMSDEREWTVIVVSDFHYWKTRCNQVIDLSKT